MQPGYNYGLINHIYHIKNINLWIIIGGIVLIIGLTVAYVSINVVDSYEEKFELMVVVKFQVAGIIISRIDKASM